MRKAYELSASNACCPFSFLFLNLVFNLFRSSIPLSKTKNRKKSLDQQGNDSKCKEEKIEVAKAEKPEIVVEIGENQKCAFVINGRFNCYNPIDGGLF